MPNGINRWVKLPNLNSGKCYITHDNGGSPYKVHIDKMTVTVYVQDEELRDCVWENSKKESRKKRDELLSSIYIKKIYQVKKARKVFVGDYNGKRYKYLNIDKGNSILVQLNENKFAFIGDKIFTFVTKDAIHSFQSPIGNSDVPYPWARGKLFTYLLREDLWLENSEIKTKDDPYADFYGNFSGSESKKIRKNQTLAKYKTIHSRSG